MAGLLSDIYSAGDTLKRRLRGLLADPAGTIGLGVERFGEDQQGLLNLMSNAHPMAGDKTVLNSPKQVAQFRGQLADKGTEQAMAGMFVGQGSKTWDAISAKKAEQMAAQGVDPRKVWSETGTWKSPDGAWRQEIPDNKAFYDSEALTDLKDNNPSFNYLKDTQPLGGVIDHKALYQAYPDVGDIQTHFMPVSRMRGASAAYAPKHDRLSLADLPSKDQTSNALHELQHAIQKREGWENGGSPGAAYIERNLSDLTPLVDPESIYRSGAKTTTNGPIMITNDEGKFVVTDGNHRYAEALKRGDKTIKTHFDPSFFDGYGGNMDQAVKDAAMENYRRLAGEAEARATQARIPLDAAQRRALFPEDSYDVPMDQLIIRGLLGK